MLKYLFAGLTLVTLSAIAPAQSAKSAPPVQSSEAASETPRDLGALGFTPFRIPTHVHVPPENGIAALNDDPAYPKYLEIYDAIQVNTGSETGLEPIGRKIEKLQKDYPKSPYPLFALAEYKYAISRHSSRSDIEVTELLERAMDLGGDILPDAYILEAKMSARDGYGKSALDSAQRAVRFAPNKPEAQFALARAHDVSKNFAEAEAAYRAFIALEPNPRRKANGNFWLGYMYSNISLSPAERALYREKARGAWQQVAALSQKYQDVMKYGDFLLTSVGDASAAADVFTGLLKQNPSDGAVRYRMALIDYLKWAKAGPGGATPAAFNGIQTRTGMPAEHVFVVSAAFDGTAVITQTMLRAKLIKNVNTVCEDTPFDIPEGATALDMAAFNDNLALATELVEHGASVNSATSDRMTALLYALRATDADMSALLLKKGARVNITNDQGANPMTLAMLPGPKTRQLVSLLLKYHADPMSLNESGTVAPVDAVNWGNIDGLDVLLTEGKVNIETKDQVGTLLAHAHQNPAMLRYLISKGANPWAKYAGSDLLVAIHNVYIYDNNKEALAKVEECAALIEEARKKWPKR
jgi:tetratricopeptide (TPR) repeat protein